MQTQAVFSAPSTFGCPSEAGSPSPGALPGAVRDRSRELGQNLAAAPAGAQLPLQPAAVRGCAQRPSPLPFMSSMSFSVSSMSLGQDPRGQRGAWRLRAERGREGGSGDAASLGGAAPLWGGEGLPKKPPRLLQSQQAARHKDPAGARGGAELPSTNPNPAAGTRGHRGACPQPGPVRLPIGGGGGSRLGTGW